jgi:DUF1680 family protein
MRSACTFLLAASLACTGLFAADKSLVDTSRSPYAKMYMVDLGDVRWTSGLMAERFEVCRNTMVPHLWEIFQSQTESHAWDNFLLAAGLGKGLDGHHHGPVFNDGDFLKWFESLAQIYAVTHDPEIDKLMDRIVEVVGKAQREDGYLHTQKIIPQRQGIKSEKEFEDREHFETYNMGHLMTAACVHYRVTGKTAMLEEAKKAADYLYAFYKRSSPELARNAICPSHYMGVVELYRVTREPRYLELAKQLIEIRDLVTNGADQNQDRIPFRQMTKAVGHAVRANYLYAGVADVYAETGDASLMRNLELIADDVAEHKLYITGATGAIYDGASPDGTTDHASIKTIHQAYGRDYQLPNLTAYNESCATIGYAMWNWRMLQLTGDAKYADLFEQSLYNGILPCISLEGKDYFYVNPLRKLSDFTWPMRWSRTRQPNIKSSFCCPPNVVRTIAEAQNYIYSLSKDTLWVHLYGGSSLKTSFAEGGSIAVRQETEYPWSGSIRLAVDVAPEREISIKLRIPGWTKPGDVKVLVNGSRSEAKPLPGTYLELRRFWKAGDVVSLEIKMEPRLWEANTLVEETLNQVAVKRGPIVYCLESNDLPKGVRLDDVALALDPEKTVFLDGRERIVNTDLVSLSVAALEIRRPEAQGVKPLFHEVSQVKPRQIRIKLVPYYAWGNRGDADMSVWLSAR